MPDNDAPLRATPATERLLNLVIALVNARTPLTRRAIRTTVVGYMDAASDDAFERMFERDKDDLRRLGVPLIVIDSGGADDIGYRIDNDQYALDPIDLTPAELAVLGLAARTWEDKMLRADTSRALTKIAAAGDEFRADDEMLAFITPRVSPIGDAYGPLIDAITARRMVRFNYQAASTGEVTARRVYPYKIAARGGGWYLVGRDLDRDDLRVFRLSRLLGAVKATGEANAFDPPAFLDIDMALGDVGRDRVALVAVLPDRASALRLRARGVPDGLSAPGVPAGRDLIHVPYSSTWLLAQEIAGLGASAVVLEPPDLRETVISILEAASRLEASDA
jgi:proteasome accessory factor B